MGGRWGRGTGFPAAGLSDGCVGPMLEGGFGGRWLGRRQGLGRRRQRRLVEGRHDADASPTPPVGYAAVLRGLLCARLRLSGPGLRLPGARFRLADPKLGLAPVSLRCLVGRTLADQGFVLGRRDPASLERRRSPGRGMPRPRPSTSPSSSTRPRAAFASGWEGSTASTRCQASRAWVSRSRSAAHRASAAQPSTSPGARAAARSWKASRAERLSTIFSIRAHGHGDSAGSRLDDHGVRRPLDDHAGDPSAARGGRSRRRSRGRPREPSPAPPGPTDCS